MSDPMVRLPAARILVVLLPMAAANLAAYSEERREPVAEPHRLEEILLWPDGMPAPVIEGEERLEKGGDGLTRRFNVSRPRVFVRRPKAGIATTGAAAIVVPGGGFARLADEHEGSDVCRWLNDLGIVAFQLAYRTPTAKLTAPHAGPVQDLQKAMLEVRRRAKDFAIDPAKLGVIGFSAGGQAAAIAATTRSGIDPAKDAKATWPDFLMLIYPYQMFDSKTKSLRTEFALDQFPPTFLAQMGDDAASPPQGVALLYFELVNRKIPAELHVYERGGHGFGLRPRTDAFGPHDWTGRAAAWLRSRGYANPLPQPNSNKDQTRLDFEPSPKFAAGK